MTYVLDPETLGVVEDEPVVIRHEGLTPEQLANPEVFKFLSAHPEFWEEVVIEAVDENDPYGHGFDWEEAKAAGIHIDHKTSIITPSGDGYYNPHGNGARHSSFDGGMFLATHRGGSEC